MSGNFRFLFSTLLQGVHHTNHHNITLTAGTNESPRMYELYNFLLDTRVYYKAHASNKKGQAREIVEFTSILYWHNLHIILHVFHMLEYLLYFLLYNIDYDFGQSFYFQWDTWLLNLYGLLEDQYSRFALFSSLYFISEGYLCYFLSIYFMNLFFPLPKLIGSVAAKGHVEFRTFRMAKNILHHSVTTLKGHIHSHVTTEYLIAEYHDEIYLTDLSTDDRVSYNIIIYLVNLFRTIFSIFCQLIYGFIELSNLYEKWKGLSRKVDNHMTFLMKHYKINLYGHISQECPVGGGHCMH
ncbi:hypothetical protein ACJX0J_029480 [Zea mays]